MRPRGRLTARVGLLFAVLAGPPLAAQPGKLRVGAKNFTESGVLAELMAQMIEAHTSLEVERRSSLGGTMICWTALTSGQIDLYAEYTGTAWATILQEPGSIRDPLRAFFQVRRRCREEYAVEWLEPFGLDNTYALAMAEERAEELGIRRISDLVRHQAKLTAGFGIEFGNRADGYPGLQRAYGLNLRVKTLEHGLAYQAIASGAIDLMDAYSTDGKLLRYRLRVLEDDRHFFPPYHAAPVVRREILDAHPEIEAVLARLAFRLPDVKAQALNYVVEAEGVAIRAAARAFLEMEGLVEGEEDFAAAARRAIQRVLADRPEPGERRAPRSTFFGLAGRQAGKLIRLVFEHLGLTLTSVLLAAVLAIPLGIAITRRPHLRRLALGAAGIVQTIPSLALLALMIPLLGLDVRAAIAALVLYATLPILRNTYTGIKEVDPDLVDAARGLGMRPREILVRVQLPLAMPTIMAGVRTSTVIGVGVATLAAFIGAGGLGEPIVEGLYLNDSNLILLGAIPAAILAVVTDLGLGRIERALAYR